AGSGGAVAPVDLRREIGSWGTGVCVRKRNGDLDSRVIFGAVGGGSKRRSQDIAFSHGDGAEPCGGQRRRVVLKEGNSRSKIPFIVKGVLAGDRVTAVAAADGPGSGGAVSPINGGAVIARGISAAGIAGGAQHATEQC